MYFSIGPSILKYFQIIYDDDSDDIVNLKVLTIRNNYSVLGMVLKTIYLVRGR